MNRVAISMLAIVCAARCAVAAEDTVLLRAADEPVASARAWDQGAGISYQSTDGVATWQSDAVLKFARYWDKPLRAKPGEKEFEAGSIRWQVSVGPYLHKLSASAKPQNDRGLSVGLGGHFVPGGSASGAIWDIDFGIVASTGKKLTPGTATLSTTYFDVGTDRVIGSAAMYYQPAMSTDSDAVIFFKGVLKGYSDNATGSENPQLNGRVQGAMAGLQATFAPLGLDPVRHSVWTFGFAPVLTLNAQRQHDTSTTGLRIPGNHDLYSILLSLPLARSDAKKQGIVPSIDVKRSTGSDLLEAREYKGITTIALSIKY